MLRKLCALGVLLAFSGVAAPSDARITRIQITRVESPTFQGTAFGASGAYEKLVGRVFGEVDPADFQDRKVVDVEFAPRNANGKVEYANDFMILRPIDPTRANGRLFYELTNRGTVLSLGVLNGAPILNDPTLAAHADQRLLLDEDVTRYIDAAQASDVRR
jgi:hypothetical protein